MKTSSNSRVILLLVLFFIVLFLRSPSLFQNPRFWAEEGKFYYFSLQEGAFFDALKLIVRGNYQLLTNLIVFLAASVPAKYAAYVSTYLSLCVTAIYISFVALLSLQRNWSTALSCFIIIILALNPQGYEIYLTATNIQWVCSVSILIIFTLDVRGWRSLCVNYIYIFVLISGLTGVCSAMLAPIYLIRGYHLRSQFHLKAGLLLFFSGVFHLIIIYSNTHPERSFSTDIFTLTFPMILQSIWSPIFGAGVVDDALGLVANVKQAWIWGGLVYVISLLLSIFIMQTARTDKEDKYLAPMLFLTWIYISMLNVFGSIGDPNALVSGWGGGRYFYLGSVCFVVLLGLAASNGKFVKSTISYLIIIVMLISGINQNYNATWKNWLISGKSWQETVKLCRELRPCEVEVWPGGDDWRFQLKRP